MELFTTLTGVAACLPQANIDTDVIMPKQFLKGITRDDLSRGLFYDLRFDGNGCEREGFILNMPAYRQARFLIVGPNFGCGSSREHAVWGLRQFGIRAIIGTSFASIFKDNCFRNGVLPITLEAQAHSRIEGLCAEPRQAVLDVDLQQCTITLFDGARVQFEIDAFRRSDLLNGRDPVASTLQHASAIKTFELNHWLASPWLKPPTAGA